LAVIANMPLSDWAVRVRILIRIFARGWDRLDNVNQDAIWIAGDEMSLPKCLVAQRAQNWQSCCSQPVVNGVHIVDLEVDQQTAYPPSPFWRNGLMFAV